MEFAYLLLAFYREHVALVSALVWPAVVVWALLRFRGDISALIARIKSARGMGIDLEFGENLSIAEDTARYFPTDPMPPRSGTSEDRMAGMVEIPLEVYENPSQVIRQAFIKTVSELRRITGNEGKAPSGRLLYVQTLVDVLSELRVLSTRQAILIKQLQLMRDRATPGSEISPENVKRFLDLNEVIWRELSTLAPITNNRR